MNGGFNTRVYRAPLQACRAGRFRLKCAGLGFALLAFASALQAGWEASLPQSSEDLEGLLSQRAEEAGEQLAACTDELSRLYEALKLMLREDAPSLLQDLEEAAPAARTPGYQILPEILQDAPPSGPPSVFSSYSWPQTRRMIREQSGKLSALREKMSGLRSAPAGQRRAACPELISAYKELKKALERAESHLRHVRFWQREVLRRPYDYETATKRYQKLLQRQRVRDLLEGRVDLSRAVEVLKGSGLDVEVPPTGAALLQLEKTLSREIEAGMARAAVPEFVKAGSPSAAGRTLLLPLCTDISDGDFLDRFRRCVESYWRLQEGGILYQVKISWKKTAASDLYGKDRPPEPGEAVDFTRHLSRFSHGCGVVTTGAAKLHVRGRAILLGPEAVAPRTLAHEVGHLLGFQDRYVRGFRLLGEEGLEILEAVPDGQDIMSSPGNGRVLKRHFEVLMSQLEH